MSMLGKEVRMSRLINPKSGKMLAITVDHSISRGIMKGLMPIQDTIDKIVAGGPNAMTMTKGIADLCLRKHAGKVSLLMKCSSFSPYQPAYDTWFSDVEEGLTMGADGVSMGAILGGKDQPEQLRNIGLMSKQCQRYGMPLIAHMYPRGEYIDKKDQKNWENIAYCVRAGAELGVDIIKTSYTGDPDTMVKVVESCPARVVIAGGDVGNDVESYLKMTRDAMDIGCAGVTYGRFVWEYENTTELIKALKFIIHENGSPKEALELLRELEAQKAK